MTSTTTTKTTTSLPTTYPKLDYKSLEARLATYAAKIRRQS